MALANDPGNEALRMLLVAAWRQKVDLLRRATGGVDGPVRRILLGLALLLAAPLPPSRRSISGSPSIRMRPSGSSTWRA